MSQVQPTEPVTEPQAINPEFTGPEAILRALKGLDLEKLEREQRDIIRKKQASKRPRAVQVLNVLEGLKRTGMKPHQFMLHSIPVIPAVFRPFSVVGNAFVPGDANELYKDMVEIRDAYNEERAAFGVRGSGNTRLALYDTAKALYGFSDPVKAKTKSRGVSGFLKKVTGTGPKFSFVQRRLLSKPQDNVSRGTIVVDPDLSLDEIGVPEEMAWKIYAPYIQRRLVMAGHSPRDAITSVRDRKDFARNMLRKEMEVRPVIYSRAPSWHKFNVVSGKPKLIDGDTIAISPLVTTGLNADFDGDALHLHVPSQDAAVKEAWDKLLPSRMLFSIRDQDSVVPLPKQELILGLYTAQNRPARKKWNFPDHQTALKSIQSGNVPLSDEIEFPGSDKLGMPKQASEDDADLKKKSDDHLKLAANYKVRKGKCKSELEELEISSDGLVVYTDGNCKATVSLADDECNEKAIYSVLGRYFTDFEEPDDTEIGKPDWSADSFYIHTKKKSAAVIGIPDREDLGDISKLKSGDMLDYVVQQHDAQRAGRHFDVRLGDKDRGLYSWATRKGVPGESGKPVALFRQPLHSHEYKDWEGEIEHGYGAGSVRTHEKGRALVTEAGPEGFSFATDNGRWRMVAPKEQGEGWLVVKAGDPPPLKYQKERMPSLSPQDLPGFLDSQKQVYGSPKIDGALQVLRFRNGKPELFSHRTSKRTGKPIEHTHRVFERTRKVEVPDDLKDQEFKGELYGERDGKVLEPQELGGLLNSHLTKAVDTKREQNIKLRLALHGVAGRDDLSHDDQRAMLDRVRELLPEDTEVMPERKDKQEILDLLQEIRDGRHPKTREGIVVTGDDNKQRKVKLFDEADVHVSRTFPGEGRFRDSHGGFMYSDKPGGMLLGRVGTGFDDNTRRELDKYVGRTARISHQGRYHSGAYRAPSLIAFHEDMNEKEASSGSIWDELSGNKSLD